MSFRRIGEEDEFRLAEASGTVRIHVGPNRAPAAVGEAATVVTLGRRCD